MKIRKAVMPVAGLGTRFLPVTKTVPKELLPIVDKPLLMFNAEEILDAGIEELVLVTGRGKSAIEDFFDVSHELEATLDTAGKSDWLKDIRYIRKNLKIISIRQGQALGLGHAVLCAQPAIGTEPFALLLGDEIMIHGSGPSATAQLVGGFVESGISNVSVIEVPKSEVGKYGIINAEALGPGRWRVKSVVEKPSAQEAPSQLALPGRYVFAPNIFKYLSQTKPGRNGEIQLTDAMTALATREALNAQTVSGQRYDAGDRLGMLIANIEIALGREDIGPQLKDYLRDNQARLIGS